LRAILDLDPGFAGHDLTIARRNLIRCKGSV
jgi:hypothetical protein